MSSGKLAKIVSVVASPYLVIPFFGLWITAYYADSFLGFLGWYLLFLALAVGVPLGYIAWSVKTGRITDIHVMVRSQRLVPMMLATVGAAVLSVLHAVLDAPHGLLTMSIILAANGVIFMLVTHFWKASIHAAAYSGSVLLLAGLVNWVWLSLAILLPVIVWARLKRRRHSIWQGLAAIAIVSANVLAMLYVLG